MQFIMLVVWCLLTIMFTQRSSCIGRLQVEEVDITILWSGNNLSLKSFVGNEIDEDLLHKLILTRIIS